MPSRYNTNTVTTTTTTATTPTTSMTNTSSPPNVVTPTKESLVSQSTTMVFSSPSAADGSDVAAMVHTPTATHGGLTHVSPFRPGPEPLRYSLSAKGNTTKSVPPVSPLKNRHSSTGTGIGSMASSSGVKQLVRQDPNACKIFLLLLQPQSKIFELIQLLYSPHDTTVGDLLKLIPLNATEQALGTQDYVGLCRPKTNQELLDLDLLATTSHMAVPSAQIVLGEILVAIPKGYTGDTVANLSKQILSNPKIVKLLKRADPLAPKRSSATTSNGKRKTSSRHRSSRSKPSVPTKNALARSIDQVHVLEKHDEMDELTIEEKLDAERCMREAMEHAAAEAAAANAACGAVGGGGGGGGRLSMISNSSNNNKSNATRHHALISHDSFSTEMNSLEDFSQQESLDESFSSWSKSFDASFASQTSICSGVSKRASRRKHRQERRFTILKRCAVAGFALMILMYWMDPHKEDLKNQHDIQEQKPMGALGILQWAFLLLVLYKTERLTRLNRAAQIYQRQQQQQQQQDGTSTTVPAPTVYMTEQRTCPFLKASGRALERFRSKYSKKLKRLSQQQQQSGSNPNKNDAASSDHFRMANGTPQHLRNFSLKAR